MTTKNQLPSIPLQREAKFTPREKQNILTDRVWRSPESNVKLTLAEICQAFLQFRAAHGWDSCDLVVGTDSQSFGRMHRHVTAICAHYHGTGGTYWYATQDIRVESKGIANNRVKVERIWLEVEHSLQIARELQDVHGFRAIVHIDASPSHKKEFTSAFSDALYGYATGCGFVSAVKPESWAATNVANKHTKAISRAQRRAEKLYTPRAER